MSNPNQWQRPEQPPYYDPPTPLEPPLQDMGPPTYTSTLGKPAPRPVQRENVQPGFLQHPAPNQTNPDAAAIAHQAHSSQPNAHSQESDAHHNQYRTSELDPRAAPHPQPSNSFTPQSFPTGHAAPPLPPTKQPRFRPPPPIRFHIENDDLLGLLDTALSYGNGLDTHKFPDFFPNPPPRPSDQYDDITKTLHRCPFYPQSRSPAQGSTDSDDQDLCFYRDAGHGSLKLHRNLKYSSKYDAVVSYVNHIVKSHDGRIWCILPIVNDTTGEKEKICRRSFRQVDRFRNHLQQFGAPQHYRSMYSMDSSLEEEDYFACGSCNAIFSNQKGLLTHTRNSCERRESMAVSTRVSHWQRPAPLASPREVPMDKFCGTTEPLSKDTSGSSS